MSFPTTEAEFEAAGYSVFKRTICRKCGAKIVFWNTPNNKLMPMNADAELPHWATCPHAEEFRKRKAATA